MAELAARREAAERKAAAIAATRQELIDLRTARDHEIALWRTSQIGRRSSTTSRIVVTGPISENEPLVARRLASVAWWQQHEQPRGAGHDAEGELLPWFHGVVSRREAELLLHHRDIGSFLVRVCEDHFGYALSFRVADRVKHYLIDLVRNVGFCVWEVMS
jgi:hypothetical protein